MLTKKNKHIIAITTGDPAGIGPEISIKSALYHNNNDLSVDLVLIGCKQHLYNVGLACGISMQQLNTLNIYDIPLIQKTQTGVLNLNNSPYVLQTLDVAIHGCMHELYVAMVTAPIHKGIINAYFQESTSTYIFSDIYKDYIFRGHTEYLAEKSHSHKVMMLLSGIDTHRKRRLRVALATTHIPLKQICNILNAQKIQEDICFLHKYLQRDFNIPNPHIKVAGINPHAGENGYIGDEEVLWMKHSIENIKNINVSGPYAGDTLFLQPADCYYCMYHDQGLAPFKYATFGHGVNITLGLPFIRTSVDHGTAIDIATKYCAEIDSMLQAIDKAKQISKHIV